MRRPTAHALLAAALLVASPLGARAADSPPARPAQDDLAAARKAIEAKDWPGAIRLLEQAKARQPGSADVHNLLGFAERHRGNLDAAFGHYRTALRLDPRHRGAHEYVGEAWLLAGNLAKAEEHLAALAGICGASCEEYRDLEKSIARYKLKQGTPAR
ncbi:MAG TPA: tetratricopeptide repeat protein [Anaeromyxobacteraceae bacterium]|nr:tetratricopeptide repeat protein [Anaeromyxobacteraceae bacterium]